MFRVGLFFILFSSLVQVAESQEIGETSASYSRRSLWLTTSVGFFLTTPDPNVEDQWTHKPGESYDLNLGLLYLLPGSGNLILLFGAGYEYGQSVEEIGQAQLLVERNLLNTLAAIGFQNLIWEGFGAYAYGKVSLIGKQKTFLKTNAFDTKIYEDSVMAAGLTGFYAITPQWMPTFTIEYNVSTSILLGVNYAF